MRAGVVSFKVPLSLRYNQDELPVTGVGPGVGMAFIKAYFPKAKHTIRIASAYFTLKGYKFTRQYISQDVQLQIVVGKEQGQHVKAAVADEILQGIEQCGYELWEAVFELVKRMKEGNFVIRDAREMQTKFHCKFYVCDDQYLFEGSANFSYTGLKLSAEQNMATSEQETISQFIEWYDPVAANAKNLLYELILRLEKWLYGVPPFGIYLKTLYLLNRIPDYSLRKGAHPPTYYQKGVIANALRQLSEFDAAFIVAATGLGKTVIGAEIAMRMCEERGTKRVVLLGPSGVSREWNKQLEGRDVNYKFFEGSILFRKTTDKEHHKIYMLEEALLQADKDTLILIDEAHTYRNQLLVEHKEEGESMVYSRIESAVERGAKICLLTATVYGTNTQNLNSLLRLLPARDASVNATGPVKTADEFAQLPVVTVLGLPHVLKMARDRGDIDDNGRPFFLYGEERRFLPKTIKLSSVRYQLFMQEEIKKAFDSNCFRQKDNVQQSFYDDSTMGLQEGHVNTVYNVSLMNWLSSPLAAIYGVLHNLQTIGKNDEKEEILKIQKSLKSTKVKWYGAQNKRPVSFQLAGRGYAKPMLESFRKRYNAFTHLLNRLTQLHVEEDDKLLKLIEIINQRCITAGDKVIVFVSRYSTGVYLSRILKAEFGNRLHVGTTVMQTKKGFALKPEHERTEVLCRFSPKSQQYKKGGGFIEYNVLICTDADGVGKNLQDANSVVNYDLPPGADVLFQRVGRVLRMITDPARDLYIYIMVPTVADTESSTSKVYRRIRSYFTRISKRHDSSQSILGSTVLSDELYKEISLDSEADVEQLTRDSELLSSLKRLSDKHIIAHLTTFEEKKDRLGDFSNDALQSALYYEGIQVRVFLILEHQSEIHYVLYNVSDGQFETINYLQLLNWISCNEKTQPAVTNMKVVEQEANDVTRKWCRNKKMARRSVKKHCALYLLPYNRKLIVKELLADIKQHSN